MRVTFTRLVKIGKRIRATVRTVAAAQSWAVDPADGLDATWLPSAETLRVSAEEWLWAQPPAAGADAPTAGGAVPPVQEVPPAPSAPAGGAPGAAPGRPLGDWATLVWWDDVDYETDCRRSTFTTKNEPQAERAGVAAGEARVLAVLNRATLALQALER